MTALGPTTVPVFKEVEGDQFALFALDRNCRCTLVTVSAVRIGPDPGREPQDRVPLQALPPSTFQD